jgi:hypothetical protein
VDDSELKTAFSGSFSSVSMLNLIFVNNSIYNYAKIEIVCLYILIKSHILDNLTIIG